MQKLEPPTRNLGPVFGKPGQFRAVYVASGCPDYIGHYRHEHVDGDVFYRAVYCEVKECNTDSMPASRLSKPQREFMAALPTDAAYVGILWHDGIFEVFPFVAKGSYKQGTTVLAP